MLWQRSSCLGQSSTLQTLLLIGPEFFQVTLWPIKYDPALQGPPFGHAAVEIWPPALHSPPSEGNSKELE